MTMAHAEGNDSSSTAGSVNITTLEKANRLLRRCRYDDAANAFKEVVSELQLQQASALTECGCDGSDERLTRLQQQQYPLHQADEREIEALEGLAICLSRQLDDAGAETAQRKALALRCRTWDGVPNTGSTVSAEAIAAKKAAVPCLRNLASFASNQGRHVDAEEVLAIVLGILELPDGVSRQDGPDANEPNLGKGKKASLSEGEDPHDCRGMSGDSSSEVARLEGKPCSGMARCPTVGGDRASGYRTSSRQSGLAIDGDEQKRAASSADSTIGSLDSDGTDDANTDPSAVTVALSVAGMAAETPTVPTAGGNPIPHDSPPTRRAVHRVSPTPPPPSPATPTKQQGVSTRRGGVSRVEEGRLVAMRTGDRRENRDALVEDMELEEIGKGGEEAEDPEQMIAVTRHHLAVVVHAQGRADEARTLLEHSVAVLRRRDPPQAIWIAQALHDLAGVVRPTDPARACALYREALQLLEDARGVNHFLTAPTLAKLGSLLGDSCVAAAATPPAPAAPAGPGAAGVARSAGLAEAVCAPGDVPGSMVSAGASAAVAVVAAAAGEELDAKGAEAMIKRAVLIQGRHLGLRHPAVASSMRAMAELYRKQGRLSEAEPLFRRAIGIWEASPGPMDGHAVAALHGLAHCVLAGAGADWLGRFEEAFALVDQAYRIASSQLGSDLDGSYSSSRLLLEALRMIRSRQRQGRGEPQPASSAIMDGVWNGRWDPSRNGSAGGNSSPADSGTNGAQGHTRSNSRGDDPRCAVCLEAVGVEESSSKVEGGARRMATRGLKAGGKATDVVLETGRGGLAVCRNLTAEIGSEEAVRAETEESHARGRLAYLPCGHRFHTHCIGRWLAHSCSCPSCRCRVEDEAVSLGQVEAAMAALSSTTPGTIPREAIRASMSLSEDAAAGTASEAAGGVSSSARTRNQRAASTRTVATQSDIAENREDDDQNRNRRTSSVSRTMQTEDRDGRAPFN